MTHTSRDDIRSACCAACHTRVAREHAGLHPLVDFSRVHGDVLDLDFDGETYTVVFGFIDNGGAPVVTHVRHF